MRQRCFGPTRSSAAHSQQLQCYTWKVAASGAAQRGCVEGGEPLRAPIERDEKIIMPSSKVTSALWAPVPARACTERQRAAVGGQEPPRESQHRTVGRLKNSDCACGDNVPRRADLPGWREGRHTRSLHLAVPLLPAASAAKGTGRKGRGALADGRRELEAIEGTRGRASSRPRARALKHQPPEPIWRRRGASPVSFQVSRTPDRAARAWGQGLPLAGRRISGRPDDQPL